MRERLEAAGAQEVGEIQQLGRTLSLFFRERVEGDADLKVTAEEIFSV